MEISNYSGYQKLYQFYSDDISIYLTTKSPNVNTTIYNAQGLPSIYHFYRIDTDYFYISDGTNNYRTPIVVISTITVPVVTDPLVITWQTDLTATATGATSVALPYTYISSYIAFKATNEDAFGTSGNVSQRGYNIYKESLSSVKVCLYKSSEKIDILTIGY